MNIQRKWNETRNEQARDAARECISDDYAEKNDTTANREKDEAQTRKKKMNRTHQNKTKDDNRHKSRRGKRYRQKRPIVVVSKNTNRD